MALSPFCECKGKTLFSIGQEFADFFFLITQFPFVCESFFVYLSVKIRNAFESLLNANVSVNNASTLLITKYDIKIMKGRKISESFLAELLDGGKFGSVTKYVQVDPFLDMEMCGDRVIIYYRGGNLLTIFETGELEGLDAGYYDPKSQIMDRITPDLKDIGGYLAKAKNIVDIPENGDNSCLAEKEIQQRIVYENNMSSNANDTDCFIPDLEWSDNEGRRFDIMAFCWKHDKHRNRQLRLTLIEVKQGCGAIQTMEKSRQNGKSKSSSGLKKHYEDFQNFKSKKATVQEVAEDLCVVLRQKHELGLVKGIDLLFKDSSGKDQSLEIEPEPDFIFLLANYHHYSAQLKNECESLPVDSAAWLRGP